MELWMIFLIILFGIGVGLVSRYLDAKKMEIRKDANSYIVWISSVEHINKAKEVINNTSHLRRIFGLYKVPDDFPQIEMYLSGRMGRMWWIIPLINLMRPKAPSPFFGIAEMKIIDREMVFIEPASEYKIPNGKVVNVEKIWGQVNMDTINMLERYYPKFGPMRLFDVNWVHISSNNTNFLNGDFLISVGGNIPWQNKNNTDKMFTEIEELKNTSNII